MKRKSYIAAIILCAGLMAGCGIIKEEIPVPDVVVAETEQVVEAEPVQSEPVSVEAVWAQNHAEQNTQDGNDTSEPQENTVLEDLTGAETDTDTPDGVKGEEPLKNAESDSKEQDTVDEAKEDELFDFNQYHFVTAYVYNTDKVYVRSGPSTTHSKVGELTAGTSVTAATYNSEWCVVNDNGTPVFICNKYLTKTKPAEKSTEKKADSSTQTTSPPEVSVDLSMYSFTTMTVNTDGVNVRKGPDTGYELLGVLSKGVKVSAAKYNNEWYIVNYNGTAVFVKAQYLTTEVSTPSDSSGSESASSSDPSNNSSSSNNDNSSSDSSSSSNISSDSKQNVSTVQQYTTERKLIDYSYLNPDTDNVLSIIRENMKKTGNSWYNEMVSKCETLNSTGEYTTSDDWDVEYVAAFYENQYSYRHGDGDLLISQSVNSDDTYSVDVWNVIWGNEDPSADIAKSVVKNIGLGSGTTTLEVVKSVTSKVNSYIAYDLAYIDSPISTVLSARRGVCHHYARCIETILNYQGIPTRTVVGYFDGEKHMWAETTIDGTTYILEGTSGRVYLRNSDKGARYTESKM